MPPGAIFKEYAMIGKKKGGDVMKQVYAFFNKTRDEDGETREGLVDLTEDYEGADEAREVISSFLGQTDESYVDKWGMVHEVYEGEDQVFAYIFEVCDDIWEDVTGETGRWLDDENNGDMPEPVRATFEKVYQIALKKI